MHDPERTREWSFHGIAKLHALSSFGCLAPHLGETCAEARAHLVEVGFYGEIQVRVLHGNAETMDRPIDAYEFGFERGNL